MWDKHLGQLQLGIYKVQPEQLTQTQWLHHSCSFNDSTFFKKGVRETLRPQIIVVLMFWKSYTTMMHN